VTDRDWIVNTMLDLDATDGEVDAAARAATPSEIRRVLNGIDFAVWWNDRAIRDLRGQLAHLADQTLGIEDVRPPRQGSRRPRPRADEHPALHRRGGHVPG
jgi:hypothetical protein